MMAAVSITAWAAAHKNKIRYFTIVIRKGSPAKPMIDIASVCACAFKSFCVRVYTVQIASLKSIIFVAAADKFALSVSNPERIYSSS